MDRGRPLGRVLVALDPSASSPEVLARAARLPLARGCILSLLHVVPHPAALPPEELAQAMQAGRAHLAALAAGVAPRLRADVELVTSVVAGRPSVEIIRRAHDEQDDLVVVGRHGERVFADALLGSTAERVFRNGSTPVLIVSHTPTEDYRRLLLAVDLSDTSRRAAETALRLVEGGEVEVRVLRADDGRAWDVTTRILQFLEGLDRPGVRWDVVNRRGDPRSVILADAAQWKPDLLVLGSHGRSYLAQQFVGSVAEAVVRAARCDVLVSRPEGHAPRLD